MKHLLSVIITILSFLSVMAEQTTDTTNSRNVLVTLMQRAEQDQLTDSLKKVLLTEQLNALQQNESKQRKLLQQQLAALGREDSLHQVRQQQLIDSLKQNTKGVPVVIGKDTLCYMYTNLGSFTPEERAEHCIERIMKAAKQMSLKRDSLLVADNTNSTDILFNETILVSVTDNDAMWMQTERPVLAQQYKEKLVHIIGNYQQSISLLTILKQIGLCLLVIFCQYLLVKLVNYFFRKIVDEKIKSKQDEWFTGIKIRDLEVVNSGKQVNAILFLSKLFRYLINIIQLYITIPILFSIFPVTQRLAETLFSWILAPVSNLSMSFINYLPKLFMIVVIVVIMRYVVRFLGYLANEIATDKLKIPGFYPDWARATFNILRIFLYAFMLVMIFPLLPSSDTEIFKGVSVFIGVIFSLGSSSIIANMVAGMVITYMRPFKIGDRIKIGDLTGDVIEKSPFVTRIKTPKNEIITVPNSNILSSSVVNYSFSAAENGLILYTGVTIGYDVPWKQVHEILLQASSRTQHLQQEPKPFVLQTSLDDFYVSYQLCVYTREAALQATIYSELHQHIQDCFNEAQVEIMSPHYRANRNGNTPAIPAEYFIQERETGTNCNK